MNLKVVVINIILIIVVFSLASAATYFAINQQAPSYTVVNPVNPNPNPRPITCTQEAKLCSDGSYVSRAGSNCAFTECPKINPAPKPAPTPNPSPNEKQVILREGQREGSLLAQKIYSNYITGLNFREYPLVVGNGEPITLHIGETASNGCAITLTLLSINGNTATFTEKKDFNKPCPICLAKNTLIDTPNGQISVQNLKRGGEIWTADKLGNRVSATIIKTSKTPAPSTHQMVHIILDDKREIFASPSHPIGDGRIFNDLSIGDLLDGSRVIVSEKVSYDKNYTYDILPSGDTGFYFANGILIDSALH